MGANITALSVSASRTPREAVSATTWSPNISKEISFIHVICVSKHSPQELFLTITSQENTSRQNPCTFDRLKPRIEIQLATY